MCMWPTFWLRCIRDKYKYNAANLDLGSRHWSLLLLIPGRKLICRYGYWPKSLCSEMTGRITD